jgi:hypothetical protein
MTWILLMICHSIVDLEKKHYESHARDSYDMNSINDMSQYCRSGKKTLWVTCEGLYDMNIINDMSQHCRSGKKPLRVTCEGLYDMNIINDMSQHCRSGKKPLRVTCEGLYDMNIINDMSQHCRSGKNHYESHARDSMTWILLMICRSIVDLKKKNITSHMRGTLWHEY